VCILIALFLKFKSHVWDVTWVFFCYSIILFADDMQLISPSVTGLQKLLNINEKEPEFLGLSVNAKTRFV
jgi:hypothetical protein